MSAQTTIFGKQSAVTNTPKAMTQSSSRAIHLITSMHAVGWEERSMQNVTHAQPSDKNFHDEVLTPLTTRNAMTTYRMLNLQNNNTRSKMSSMHSLPISQQIGIYSTSANVDQDDQEH